MQQKKTLAKLVKEIEETEAIANRDLSGMPIGTRVGHETAVRRAKDKLEELKLEYYGLVKQTSAGILLLGDPQKTVRFSALAESEGEVFVVDPEEPYRTIAAAIEPAIGAKREFTQFHTPMLYDAIRNVANELGVHSMEVPRFTSRKVLSDFNSLVAFVRELIRGSIGDQLTTRYLSKQLVDKAFASKFTKTVVPAIVVRVRQDEVEALKNLFLKGMTTLDINTVENVNQELVLSTFQELNKAIKNANKAK